MSSTTTTTIAANAIMYDDIHVICVYNIHSIPTLETASPLLRGYDKNDEHVLTVKELPSDDQLKKMTNLHTLYIGCSHMKYFPDIDILVNLKNIIFYECRNLFSIGRLPTSIQNLEIRGCHELKCLFQQLSGFTNLKNLIINDCRAFDTLPLLPQSLLKLDIHKTIIKTIPANLPPELQFLNIAATRIAAFNSRHTPQSLAYVCTNKYAAKTIQPKPYMHIEICDVYYCDCDYDCECDYQEEPEEEQPQIKRQRKFITDAADASDDEYIE